MNKFLPIAGVLLSGILFTGCKEKSNQQIENQGLMEYQSTEYDPHSCANYQQCRTKHLDLAIKLDFNAEKLSGVASWAIENLENSNKILFDTKGLIIQDVTLNDGEDANWNLSKVDPIFGQSLQVEINASTEKVNIRYETTSKSEALKWLNPAQTASKTDPFLFTQSQAILARSWVPCQDGPGNRFTYSADVEAPKEYMVLMSATNPQTLSPIGRYHFEMNKPISSYLLALACGKIEYKSLGERTGVYAEPTMIDAAHFEFEGLEEMLTKAESLYGPYQWDRYDVLVLPPAFPFGGMENPKLTFATPTIITGDRSLISLIAHELAHSWSGNLVTNANWNDFWLNEGFTVYFEERIMELLYGREFSEMIAKLSYDDLIDEIAEFREDNLMSDTRLKLDLKGRDPDDGLTSIAYDKGYLFLRHLEETFGRQQFDAFLNEYFTAHAFKTVTTETFLRDLTVHLLDANPELSKTCNIEEWVYGEGLPEIHPIPGSAKLVAIENQLSSWKERQYSGVPTIENATTQEWVHFVKKLPNDLKTSQIQRLDSAFKFTGSTNSEIACVWYVFAVNQEYKPAFDAMENFLIVTGRRKFLLPIYKALIKTSDGRSLAKQVFERAKENYHPVSSTSIEELLNEPK